MRFALPAALLLIAAAPPASERIVSGDGATDLMLEGAPMRIRLHPSAPAMPLFAIGAAFRARLKAGMFGGEYRIGPVRMSAPTAVADLQLGTHRFKRRVAWTREPFAPGYDGVIGPGSLPEPIVRFALREPRAGERTVALPLDQPHWGIASGVMMVGTIKVNVRFDPDAPRTVANAAAGVTLATAYRGTVAGAAEMVPIVFGIRRPVRALTLAEPVAIGPLSFTRLGVRVGDGGAVNALREADADPEEVQVVAKGKPGRAGLLIGADLLGRCSSLVFDKRAKQVRLSCI